MTVGELLDALSKMPRDLEVVISDWCGEAIHLDGEVRLVDEQRRFWNAERNYQAHWVELSPTGEVWTK